MGRTRDEALGYGAELAAQPTPELALSAFAAHQEQDRRQAGSQAFGAPDWLATQEDASALLRSLGVIVVPDGAGGFVHNGAIHLLDERGRLRGLYEFDQWPQALEAAQRLAFTRPRASR